MATEVAVEAPAPGAFSRRLRERLSVWRRLFLQNWNLFKASRIGVIGLAIMIAFVVLALAAPFMGLRDPIRWTAPDEDLIKIEIYWTADSSVVGSELHSAPPVNQPVAFRVLPDSFDSRSDRLYVSMGNRLYAFRTQQDLGGDTRNAWGTTHYFNVSGAGVDRTISVPPLAMNYGDYVQNLPDYELYLGTDDGRLYILRDKADGVLPGPSDVARLDLDGAITGLAAYNGDMVAPGAIEGTVVSTYFNGTAWVDDPVPSQLEDQGEFASLALNATGVPHVAFYHMTTGQPRAYVRTGTGWSVIGQMEPYSTSVNIGLYTSLAIGSDNRPRVAYYDEAETALKFAMWNGAVWRNVFVEYTGEVGKYASLALDGSDNPHIAYYNESSRQPRYASCDRGVGCLEAVNWTIEDIPEPGADAGTFISLAVEVGGTPHVAYYDATNRRLQYATKPGTWQNATIDSGGVYQFASLALDSAGQPAIAYYDGGGGGRLKYADGRPTWGIPQVVDDPLAGNVGRYASLAFNSSDNPGIAYHDATNLDLKYARWNASSPGWDDAVVTREVALEKTLFEHVGLHTSLEYNATDAPHIAHYAYRAGRTTKNIVVAGTANGTLYAIDAGIPATIGRLARSKVVTSWDYRIRWEKDVGAAVHLAGAPMSGVSKVPLYSPAFNQNGTVVFGGTANGLLLANRTEDGSSYWARTVNVGFGWSSAPTVYMAAEGPVEGHEIVYAATDVQTADDPATDADETGNSFLHARFAETGESLPQWLDPDVGFAGYGGAVPMGPVLGQPDGGNLTQPSYSGGNIYLGSSSGWLYAIRRDGIGALPPASVRWRYRDQSLLGLNARFASPSLVLDQKSILLVTANHDGGTPDPADDRGILYSFKMDGGVLPPLLDASPSWKKTFRVPIHGQPASWSPPKSIDYNVWAAYGGASVTGVSALRTTGNFLAPSPPSWVQPYPSGNQYWLGLDSQGRDIFSQVIWGSRIALLVGFLSAFFSVLIGVVVGLIAGYVGGKTESVLMRFTDVILVLPGLPLIITLAAVLGPSIFNIVLVIALLGWPGIARIIRAEVLSLKERPFIDSARVTGASTTRIVFRHIAPNVLPLAFLYMTFAVSGAILTEAALSFIGLGDINTMSWGIMLQLVSQSKALTAWWWLLPPGLAITLISLAFFLVGRAFDEIVNPRLRKR